jgi:hypothetical protein
VDNFYLTYTRTATGFYRLVLRWRDHEWVYRALLTDKQALEFISDAKKDGVPFELPPVLKVKPE